MLRWAGVDLGAEETYKLQQALKILVREKGAQNIRFWGKISGIRADYYIVEGVSEGDQEDQELPPDFEKRGEGVNLNTYWVTTLYDWVELPDVSP